MTSFTQNAVKGIKWSTLASVNNNLVRLAQVAVLTRFLAKEDFGTIAIAVLFIGFTDLFLEMGLSAAIIHKQNITKSDYSSLFWFNVLTGIILTTLLILVAPGIASYYNDNSLTPIIQLLSFNVFFSALGRQHRTQRHKQLNFRFMALVENSSSFSMLALSIVLAVNGYGVYSLVYSTMLGILMPNLIYLFYGLRKDRNITFHFRLRETKPYLKIGVFQLGSGILDFFSREMDILIISFFYGKDILGAYSLCKRIAQSLYGLIVPTIVKVSTPLFAQIQHSLKEVSQKFTILIEIVSTVCFFVFGLVAILSPALLRIVYGQEYVEYHDFLFFLSMYYGIISVGGAVSSAQIALGRTDVGFYWTIFRIISSMIFIYLGSMISPTWTVIMIFLSSLVSMFPFWIIQVKPLLNLSLKEYLSPQIFSFVLVGVLIAGDKIFFGHVLNYIEIIATTILFILIFSIIHISFRKDSYVNNKILSVICHRYPKLFKKIIPLLRNRNVFAVW